MKCSDILGRILEAHGGAALWDRLTALEAEISVWGFLFTAKRRPVLRHVPVTAYTQEPRFVFHDFPAPGRSAEFLGDEAARIVDPEGKVAAERLWPRTTFKESRRILHWDDLDFTYFGGYATWNYMLTPFLFLRHGFEFEVMNAAAGDPSQGATLRVTFPPNIPTHCRTQIFHFDENGLLRRLDYTAEVIGSWARAAHLCENYRNFDGYMAPTRRRVFPLPWGQKPLPVPTLVAIDIHHIRPVYSQPGT